MNTVVLLLDVQQSGIYNLSLSGSVPWVPNCHQAFVLGHPIQVKIQGVMQGETLTGQITLSATPIAAEFTAQAEKATEQTGQEH